MKLTKEQILKKLQENPELTFSDLESDSCDETLFNEVKEEFESSNLDITIPTETKRYQQFTANVKALGDGEVEAIVATEDLDRHGEVIDIKGLDLTQYKKNPIVAWMHNYDEPPIGKALSLTKTRTGQLISKFKMAVDEYPFAAQIYALIKGGYLNAVSIGFIPEEMQGNRFTKSQMLEFSVVLLPANANALITAKKKGLDIDLVLKKSGQNISVKGGENMKLTIKEIKARLQANSELKYEEIKDIADEADYTAAKAEIEAESKKTSDKEEFGNQLSDLAKTVTGLVDAVKKLDAPVVKDINLGKGAANTDVNVNKGEKSKEVKFLYYARGLQTGNFSEYENVVGKDAMNTGDTSVVLPPAEFVAEIERLEEKVGIARQFATVRRSGNGKGVTFHKGDDDVEIFDTAEGGVKKSTKLSYTDYLLEWRKFAAILPITDELTEDSAIDLWKDATTRFARAYAKKEDYLVFLEPSNTGVKNKGLLYETGTNRVILDTGLSSITYDVLVDMIFGVPTESAANGRFFLNREIVGQTMKIKDSHGDPIWQKAMADGTPATILGKPYSVIDALPGVNDADEDLPFAAFGDLRFVTLGERTDLNIRIFDSGIVGDPDEEDQDANTINLLTQDAQAMRAVKRMNAVVRFPEAFSVAVLGSTLS